MAVYDGGTVKASMEMDTKKFQSGIMSARTQVKQLEKETGTMSSKIAKAGQQMSATGKKLTKTLTLPLAAIGATSVKISADFQSAMSKVKAISGATGQDFKELEEKAKKLGETTKFSAQESAQGMKYLAMAGMDTNQIIGAMPGLLDLAAASGTDLATTADIVSDNLANFNLKADETGKLADIMAVAATNSNTSVRKLGESYKQVGPVAGSFNYTAEETTAVLGVMASNSIKAGKAGRSLKTAMLRMNEGTGKAGKWMEKLGITMSNTKGEMLPLQDVVSQLKTKFAGLTEEQKNQAASAIFGKESVAAMLAVIDDGSGKFDELHTSMKNSSGEAKKMADIMLDNLKGAATKLKSALGGMAITIGEQLIPYVKTLTEWINKWVNRFNSLDESTQETIVKIGLLVASIGPLLLIFGKIATLVTSAISLFSTIAGVLGTAGAAFGAAGGGAAGLMAALSAILGPVGLAVAAIGGLITVGYQLHKNWNKISTFFKNMWVDLATHVENFTYKINMFVANMVKESLDKISAMLDKLPGVEDSFEDLRETVDKAITEEQQRHQTRILELEQEKRVNNMKYHHKKMEGILQEQDNKAVNRNKMRKDLIREKMKMHKEEEKSKKQTGKEIEKADTEVNKTIQTNSNQTATTIQNNTKSTFDVVKKHLNETNKTYDNSIKLIKNKLELWRLQNDKTKDSVSYLEKKVKSQKDEQDLLNKKIQATKEALETVTHKYGENSTEAQNLENRLLRLKIKQEELNGSLDSTVQKTNKAKEAWRKYQEEITGGTYRTSSGGSGGTSSGGSGGSESYYNENTGEHHVFDEDDDGNERHTVIDSEGNMTEVESPSQDEINRISREHNVDRSVAEDMARTNERLDEDKYHTGGFAGFDPFSKLKENEVFAKLQKGEFILSKKMLKGITTQSKSKPKESIDYDKLGRVLSKYMKPDIKMENNFDNVSSESSSNIRKQQQKILREMEFQWK